jgi:hypothetical protein
VADAAEDEGVDAVGAEDRLTVGPGERADPIPWWRPLVGFPERSRYGRSMKTLT